MVEVELASLNKVMKLAEYELKRMEEKQHGRPRSNTGTGEQDTPA